MGGNDISFLLIGFLAIVIAISVWFLVSITKDINTAIRRCERMKRWAKEELERRTSDE